jgi:hypothetical protein
MWENGSVLRKWRRQPTSNPISTLGAWSRSKSPTVHVDPACLSSSVYPNWRPHLKVLKTLPVGMVRVREMSKLIKIKSLN